MSISAKIIQAAAGVGGGAAPTDPNFSDTTLLLQGDTSNESMLYNAFGDASTNAHDITPVGGVHGTPFSPYNESWSVEFDGSDYLSVPNDTGFDVSSGDFTIEAWVYPNNVSGIQSICAVYNFSSNRRSYVFALADDHIEFTYSTNGQSATNVTATGTISISANEWTHVVVARSGNSFKSFVNGVEDFSVTLSSSFYSNTADPFTIGALGPLGTLNDYFDGYISNVRLAKGTAIYTSNFTPSTTPLTDVSGTSLLTCNANRFIDTSSNDHTITANGDPAIRGFSPFADTDTVTGSGYFDGSGDYLQTDDSDDFGTGDFTVEAWVYPTIDSGSDRIIVDTRTNSSDTGFVWFLNSSEQLSVYTSNGIRLTSSTSLPVNSWSHVVFTRESGTIEFFINGASDSTASYTTTITSPNNYRIGARNDLSSVYYDGYMANFRVVAGTAVYTSAFTPPTSPLTAVTGTSLLTLQNRGANRNIGFIDSSHPTREITRNGNVTQGSFSPFSQDEGKWGNYFDGSGDYLLPPAAASFTLGTGNFTFEAWVYPESTDSVQGIFGVGDNTTNAVQIFYEAASERVRFNVYNGALVRSTNQSVPLNTWTHFAMVREGTGTDEFKIYINGVLDTTSTSSENLSETEPVIGRAYPSRDQEYFTGYISNLRLVKGTAVYTTNFDVSTPLTAITNTSLLTCQSNRFVDNSSNAHSITVNGDPEVTPFSPFAPSTAYDPATKGGSGYFDGADDHLDLGNSSEFSTSGGNYLTCEAWVYPTSNGSERTLFFRLQLSGGFPGYILRVENGTPLLGSSANDLSSSVAISEYEWSHLAYVFDSSGNQSIYVNGVRTATRTNGPTTMDHSTNLIIGGDGLGGREFYGYIADAKITKGATPLYSGASFTLPTAPADPVGASLCLNFTNAGIYDGTGRNVLETVGDAHVENSVKKYGTGSMQFDGTADRLVFPPSEQITFGTGDFTIEFWANSNNVSGSVQLGFLQTSDTAGGLKTSYTTGVQIFQGATEQGGPGLDGGLLAVVLNVRIGSTTTAAITANTWHHIALVRSSGTVTLYVDGVSIGSDTVSGAINGQHLVVGGYYDTNYLYDGYIDDLRITKGVARYTANFTPPAAKLPNL